MTDGRTLVYVLMDAGWPAGVYSTVGAAMEATKDTGPVWRSGTAEDGRRTWRNHRAPWLAVVEFELSGVEEYLEITRAQRQRDRDRFMGVDRHEAEPVYDARNGSLASGSVAESFTFDADEFMRRFSEGLEVAVGRLQRDMEPVHEALRAWFALLPVADEEDRRPLVGVLNSEKRARHTYPRPRREWWLR